MRPDFRSVLTHGKGNRYPDAQFLRAAIVDDDGVPIVPRARSRTLAKGWREGSNVRYGLIGRYLESQVGRRWDAVRSDLAHALCDALRDRHALSQVETGVRIGDDGAPVDSRGRTVTGLYVDPRDGTLRNRPYSYRSARYRLRLRHALLGDPDRLPLSEADDLASRHELRRVEGVWYEFRYRRVPAPGAPRNAVVVGLGPDRVHLFEDLSSKRQLGRPEIKRLRLAEWTRLASALSAAIDRERDDPVAAASLVAIRKAAIALRRG